MRITEQLLWQYIDGECTREQCEAVERALEADEQVAATFEKLMNFHKQFQGFFKQRPSRTSTHKSYNPANLIRGNRVNMNASGTASAKVIDLATRTVLNAEVFAAIALTYVTLRLLGSF